MQSETLAYPAT